MRQILAITAGAIILFSLIAGGFALNQANNEEIELSSRMQSRTQVLADSLAESIVPPYLSNATSTMYAIVNRFVSNERLVGLAVFESSGEPIVLSENIPAQAIDIADSARVMDSDEPFGRYVRFGNAYLYVHTIPLHDEERVVGALTVIQNATYIDEGITQVWTSSLSRLLVQVIFFAGTIFLLLRFVVYRPIKDMTETLKSLRAGAEPAEVPSSLLWAPLTSEITKVTTSLKQARSAASEEARMRLEKLDTPWTAERLKEFMKANYKDRPLFVVSNREPYVHEKSKNGVAWSVPAGGVVAALEPVMEACGGMWIAHGSGSADKATADADGKLRVPPDEPKYTLKRIWLSDDDVRGHYTGFSNEALWPLCHLAHVRPLFRLTDWERYKRVNGIFARALLAEIRNVQDPIILVQDYHFALLPAMIKKARPDAHVALFWHIPWPSPEAFSICPWREQILEGMLGADLIGFHTQQYCGNFIDTVSAEIEARVDYDQYSVTRGGKQSYVKPFPISIAFTNGHAKPPAIQDPFGRFGIKTPKVGLGVDRLDYTKGILERLKGIEFLLDNHPEHAGQFTFLQIASPSRESVAKYREYGEQVAAETDRINKKFGTRDWKPVHLERRHFSHEELQDLYRAADICVVSSLHDGMNLVSKEYIAARDDETGVLIISQFIGAAKALTAALIINPYSADMTSEAMHAALTMPKTEQHRRMKSLRRAVSDYNVYRWSAELVKALSRSD